MENPSKSEVIGRCGGDEKKRMITQNRQNSNAKKKKENKTKLYIQHNKHKVNENNKPEHCQPFTPLTIHDEKGYAHAHNDSTRHH